MISPMLCECGCGLELPRPGLRFVSKIHSRRHWMRTHPERKKISARKCYLRNRKAILQRNKNYRLRNPDKLDASRRLHYERNKERYRAYFKKHGKLVRQRFKTLPEEKKAHIRKVKLKAATRYYWRHRDKVRQKAREYTKRNRAKIAAATRARIRSDVRLQIRERLRTRLKRAVKGQGRLSIQTIIGCTWDELKLHIEKQFTEGMTWENRHLWHIDHIKPCALFDFRDPEQQRRCFHFSNLQPLWWRDNIVKGAKILPIPCSA